MELRELHLLYNRVPDLGLYKNGTIRDVFLIHKNNKAVFLTLVEYLYKGNKVKGVFSFNHRKKKILFLTKSECLEYLKYLDYVLNSKMFTKLLKEVMSSKKEIDLISNNKYFVSFNDESELDLMDSTAFISFEDNNKSFNTDVCILHNNAGLTTCYAEISRDLLIKEEFKNVDYSCTVDLEINANGSNYNDFGNIRETKVGDNSISFLIEPLETTFLDKSLVDNQNFTGLSPGEIIGMMLNSFKISRIGEINNTNSQKRKFRYITILNNFDIDKDEIYIGDVVLSKKIKEIDISKIKSESIMFVYVSIYVVANDISVAKDIAVKKINNIKNIIELLDKNSSIYQMYNKTDKLNDWNIEKLFIDYKLSNQFYIYNIFDSSQAAYGSNINLTIKGYGMVNNNSEIIKYKNALENILYKYDEKIDKLYNAILWLNKTLEALDNQIEHAIIYINIAIEYVANGETCKSLVEEYPETEEIFNGFFEVIKNSNVDNKTKKMLEKKLNDMINNVSLNKKFDAMLERLKIKPTKRQKNSYKNIRKSRNNIEHNNHPIDIVQREIIECYILISKVIFYKMTEGIDEYI